MLLKNIKKSKTLNKTKLIAFVKYTTFIFVLGIVSGTRYTHNILIH